MICGDYKVNIWEIIYLFYDDMLLIYINLNDMIIL